MFEPTLEITNNLPPKDNPGPAHYNSVGRAASKQFNATGNTTTFISKVPNCKDIKTAGQEMPGPGAYIKLSINQGSNDV